jgi:AcrR family transcriptional regulator
MAGRSEAGRRRHTAEERRRLVIDAARAEFVALGLFGATGEAIAYRAGISHPYLLRLFGSKRELFLAVVDHVFDELIGLLRSTAEATRSDGSAEALEAELRGALLTEDRSLALLQFCTACSDDDVRPTVRRRFADFYEELERASGASEDQIRDLLARLLLAGAAQAMRLPEAAGRERWARRLLGADLGH